MNEANTELELEKAIERIEVLERKLKAIEARLNLPTTKISAYDLNSVHKNKL